MEKYNLDEKGGLFRFAEKKASKVLKNGELIVLKHFLLSNPIEAKVSEVADSTFRIRSIEKAGDAEISKNDHVILEYGQSGNKFVITGTIDVINSKDPIDLTIKVIMIEKLKDLVKEKKQYVSLPSTIKIIGIPDGRAAVIGAISFGGVKINCNEDIMPEDIIDLTIFFDKVTKINFKGKVVRKNRISDTFEYGIEYAELGESCNKVLTRFMYDYENKL